MINHHHPLRIPKGQLFPWGCVALPIPSMDQYIYRSSHVNWFLIFWVFIFAKLSSNQRRPFTKGKDRLRITILEGILLMTQKSQTTNILPTSTSEFAGFMLEFKGWIKPTNGIFSTNQLPNLVSRERRISNEPSTGGPSPQVIKAVASTGGSALPWAKFFNLEQIYSNFDILVNWICREIYSELQVFSRNS